MRNTYQYIIIISLALSITSCVKKKQDSFDRSSMLSNLGNNVIIPAYEQFSSAAGELKTAEDAFLLSPDLNKLDQVKTAFANAYMKFEATETYSFTASADMRTQFNSFPADTEQIISNIASGSYDLTAVNNLRAKGFPAIDYLLFSRSAQEILDLFSTDINAQKRKQYLSDIVSDMQVTASSAHSQWSSSYISTFIASTGTDIGSSIGVLVNDMSFASEEGRRQRVGNCIGYVGLVNSGVTHPTVVEAYYSAHSKELFIENIQQLKSLFKGSTGQGFDDYLDYINAQYNGQPLSAAISSQFDVVIQKATAIPVEFSIAADSNKPDMDALFLEMKKLTVMIKVDMSSQLGVIINYADNDGD